MKNSLIIALTIILSYSTNAQEMPIISNVKSFFGYYSYEKVDTNYLINILNKPIWNPDYESKMTPDYRIIDPYLKSKRNEYSNLNKKKLNKKTKMGINSELEKIIHYENLYKNSLIVFNKKLKDYNRQLFVEDSIKEFERKGDLNVNNKTNSNDSLIQIRREKFITPLFISKIIGMAYATQEHLEKDMDLFPITNRGGMFYYSINEYNVGMRFFGETSVLVEMSLRLFGEDGSNYEKQLIKDGFVLKGTEETENLEIESDLSSQLLNGELRTYQKGNVICQISDGSYLGVKFYRIAPQNKIKKKSKK